MKKEKKTIYLVLQMSQGSGAVYTSMVSNSGWWHGKDIGVISTVDYTYLFTLLVPASENISFIGQRLMQPKNRYFVGARACPFHCKYNSYGPRWQNETANAN